MLSLPLTNSELSQGAIEACALFDEASSHNLHRSLGFLLGDFDGLDISIAESDEESVSESVPGN